MRVAIMCLRKKEILRWLLASHNPVPFVRDLLFDNETDECFGIGLADYPKSRGAGRIKIYNAYKRSRIQAGKTGHVRKLCALFGIPDKSFRKDLDRFANLELSSLDWNLEHKAAVKAYFGPFRSEQLFKKFSRVFSGKEITQYRELGRRKLLPEAVYLTGRYSSDGHSLRVDLCNRKQDIQPYLKAFDRRQQVARYLSAFRRIFPDLHLQWISLQGVPVNKIQFYFFLGSHNKLQRPFSEDPCR